MTTKERELSRLEREIQSIELFLKYLPMDEETLKDNLRVTEERAEQIKDRISTLLRRGTEALTLLPQLKRDLEVLKK